jgi:glycosyltransferase involved in cell wall biosynthesis
LQNHIVFLGLKENPYPFIKQSDIYIQPSRFEGKSLAIDEAKILHKPIILTNFSTAKDQITNEVNGLIVEMNPEALVNGILRMQSDTHLKNQLIENLCNEIVGNESEIEKIYKII